MHTIYNLIGRINTYLIPVALIMLALCIGIKTAPNQIVYKHRDQVMLLASALNATNALKPIPHRVR